MQKLLILASFFIALSLAQNFRRLNDDEKGRDSCACDKWKQYLTEPITVTGSASQQVKQNRFLVVASYSNLAKKATDALAANNKVMNAAQDQLEKEKYFKQLEVSTTGFSIYPSYKYNYDPKTGQSTQEFEGYRVTNSISVRSKADINERAGDVIDLLIANGLSNIDQVQFYADDATIKQAQLNLYDDAVNDANLKFKLLAQYNNLKKVNVKSVQLLDNNSYQPPVIYAKAAAADSASTSTQLSAGSSNVQVSIQITYNVSCD